MKYHKIRGVAMETCSAEQKAAYNLAFRLHISHGEKYKKIAASCPRFVLAEAEDQLLTDAVKQWKRDGDPRLDIDAVFSALRAGLHNYLLRPFIASDYEKIGKAFPAKYM